MTVRKKLTPSLGTDIVWFPYSQLQDPKRLIYIELGRVVPGVIDELRIAFDTALPGGEGVICERYFVGPTMQTSTQILTERY